MDTSFYNPNLIDFTKEPIFFGKGKNTQRYDVLKYKFFDDLNDKMLGQYWRPDEIDVARDKRDFHIMPDNMKNTYTRVLQRLIFLDSAQGRGMLQTFGNYITNPEFESLVTTWEFFENIHSRSYTHILRSVYENPTEIFDESFTLEPLVKIAKSIISKYDLCFSDSIAYLDKSLKYKDFTESDGLKESLLRLLIEINILEGLRFFSGFATIWSMHYSQGLMERTTNILKQINRDELDHLQVSQYLLRVLKASKEEGFTEIYKKIEPQIPEMFRDAMDEEFEWIDFIFEKGSFLGMTPDLAKLYLKHLCNKRLKAIHAPTIYEGVSKNPIPWVDSYIHYDAVEVLPQETELTNYVFDNLDKGISDSKIKSLRASLK